MLELTKDLEKVDKAIAQEVLQDNSYWAHAENISISMLCDEREEVRRKAALWILKARREFNMEEHPRKFIPPVLNFEVNLKYFLYWLSILVQFRLRIILI